MSNKITIRSNLLSPLSETDFVLKKDHIMNLEAGKITGITPASANQPADLDMRDCLAIPGLIDLHVHLSQYRIKGHYRNALLPWLNEIVFPEETKSADTEYAYQLAEDFITALYKSGTTTAVIYTSPFPIACETAFETARLHGLRAFIGMTLMDRNSPNALQQDTKQAMDDCLRLIEEYHDPEAGLQYIFTPRFAPTCSLQLMQWIGKYATQNGLWIQTHLSENKDEIKWVKDLFGLDTYTDVYAKAGLLTNKTILAHCIHLNDRELSLLKASGSKIAHCPDSNFYLRSGQFPLAQIRQQNIPFALGSDVGAGTSLNMLYHAKMYNFRQSDTPVSPADAFYRITLGAARLLGLQDKTGSIEVGKEADVVFLKLPDSTQEISTDILSELIFTGHEWAVKQVYSKGVRKV